MKKYPARDISLDDLNGLADKTVELIAKLAEKAKNETTGSVAFRVTTEEIADCSHLLEHQFAQPAVDHVFMNTTSAELNAMLHDFASSDVLEGGEDDENN